MAQAKRTARIRRGGKAVLTDGVKANLTSGVDRYFALEKKVKKLQAEMAEVSMDVFATMRAKKLDSWPSSDGANEAVIEIKTGKSTTYVDPETFFKAVKRDEFFSAVKVSITEAKQVLPGKAFDRIAQVTPGEKKPPSIAFRAVKKSK